MALKLIEGFDHLRTTTSLSTKGWIFGGSNATFSPGTTGRINGTCLRHNTGGNDGSFVSSAKGFPSSTTLYFGQAFRFAQLPVGAFGRVALLYDTTAFGSFLAQVVLNAAGKLEVRNSANTVLATGTTTLAVNTWYFIEARFTFNGASSIVEVRLNGVSGEIASTTVTLGSTACGAIRFLDERGGPSTFFWGASVNIDHDDFYVLDTSGSDNVSFLGDVHVETVYPSADGANDQWTPDTGSNSADRVDENEPDNDTTYIADATVGHKTTFDMGTLAVLSGSVFGVQTNLYARKDDAATRQIAPVVRQGGSDFDGSTVTLGVSYADFSQIYENDPSDAADWTVGKVNSAEFGVKVVT